MELLRTFKEKTGLSRLSDTRRQELFMFAAAAVVLIGAFSTVVRIDPSADATAAGGSIALPSHEKSDAFKSVNLAAKSAYVLDIKSGKVLYERNANTVLPLASVTKVMMAMTAVDLVPSYTVIRVDSSFLDEEGDSGLYADESWRLKDLLDYSLVVSSNDGANAIAAVAGSVSSGSGAFDMGRREFIRKMNEKADEIGLTATSFNNATGLDANDSVSGGYGTARDAAHMFAHALANYPDIFEATKYSRINVSSLDNIPHTGRNTNIEVNRIPGLIASKTGYTELSGGNLVVVFDAGVNRPVVVSVLGSTYDGRFDDVYELVEASLAAIAAEEPSTQSALIETSKPL